MPSKSIQIVGAGIAGLTTAIALASIGQTPTIIDRAGAPQPLGAGIQLGPNAVRILDQFGLSAPLRAAAFAPRGLRIRGLEHERTLAYLPLGDHFLQRYGAPYLTLHRADLHRILLDHCLELGLQPRWGQPFEADALTDQDQITLGADGVWSTVRQQLPSACAPEDTGSVAIRGILPDALNARSELGQEVTVWTSDRLHVVGYPISGGRSYSLVLVCPTKTTLPKAWGNPVTLDLIEQAAGRAQGILRGLLHAVRDWSSWPLYACPPLSSAEAMAGGQIALLGDAAHPMRPHMAQGAGMAIEDAWVLAQCLREAQEADQLVSGLAQYARRRQPRVARVQAAAERAGLIFQLPPPLSWARNLAMASFGKRLLDQPWLYGGKL